MEGDFIVKELNIFPNGFQSTPSAWRVTPDRRVQAGVCEISIHTLRMEGDWELVTDQSPPNRDFNPHPPHGG